MKTFVLVSVCAILVLVVMFYTNGAQAIQRNTPTPTLSMAEMQSSLDSTLVPPDHSISESLHANEGLENSVYPSGFPDMRLYRREFPTPGPYSPDPTPTETMVQANSPYPPPGSGVQLVLPRPAATVPAYEQENLHETLTYTETIYLPYVRDELFIGVESWEYAFNLPTATVDEIKAQITDIKPDFVRMPVYWKYIEPNDDDWRWPSYYSDMVTWLVDNDILPILTLKWTPDWALAPGEDKGCGRPADVNEFAEFAYRLHIIGGM